MVGNADSGRRLRSTITRHSGDAFGTRTHRSKPNARRTGFHKCTCDGLLLRTLNLI